MTELKKRSGLAGLLADIRFNKSAYILVLPLLAYYILFHYMPMYGVVIAFKDFSPAKGIMGSDWIGLEQFRMFFSSDYAYRVIRNTLLISVYSIAFGFPVPILLALLMNEIRSRAFKRVVQTCSYLPHFISTVVICGMLVDFCSRDGLFNTIFGVSGNMLQLPEMFRRIFVASGIWQTAGWNTILYLAALTQIDLSLYDAAKIDGAGRLRQTLAVTLPGIMPTIITLFILRVGQVMSVGFEKIILLYNPLTYETADVISSFVYRKGLIEFNYGYSTAVGLFNSVINFALLLLTNTISRKASETSLW
ncbi:ABC transporter permease subunit [Ruminococcaceae bacterium OttesenSCG-928-L11]|nr:ABC transporter permease subunit [Ruminococcaceae bacterium OttesenSCG-928-L11]